MKKFLHDEWWRLVLAPPRSLTDRVLLVLLGLLSYPYRLAVYLRNLAYDLGLLSSVKLSKPVISIGNLTVGGTGKTSCVELFGVKLKGKDKQFAILSRGYGAKSKGSYSLSFRQHQLLLESEPVADASDLPDEPQLLARHLEGVPVLVGKKREITGLRAISQCRAEAMIMDDGFQYRRLRRDLEVVLVGANMPFSGWSLLPRGPMREPLDSIKRADIIIVTKSDQSVEASSALKERLQALNPKAVLAIATHEAFFLRNVYSGEEIPFKELSEVRVGLFSSIGDPQGFEKSIENLGAVVLKHFVFPDHHRYRNVELQEIFSWASSEKVDPLITTEKDLIRLEALLPKFGKTSFRILVLGIRMCIISGNELIDDRLSGLLGC